MKLAIGSDHAGIVLKNKLVEYLKDKGHDVEDVGTHTTDSCDYPVYARAVANKVASKEVEKGILVCGSGVGVSIVANKVKGVRAVLCREALTAKLSREHNDSNVICLGERFTGDLMATDIVDTWLNTPFEGGRHQRRVDMIDA